MSDDKKNNNDSDCNVHGPACPVEPVRKLVREIGEILLNKTAEEARSEKSGPSRAVSNAYRQGWDGIFGKKQPVGEA